MNPIDAVPRASFLKLTACNKGMADMHRARGEMLLWNEPPDGVNVGSAELKRIAYDAALYLTGAGFVEQGPPWKAIALTLPGLQLCLRDGIDRPNTFAGITLLNEKEFLVGAGTFDELQKQHIIGIPNATWLTPLPPIVDLLRRRAAEYQIELPKRLAPPLGEFPSWAKKHPAFGATQTGGARVTWEPAGVVSVAAIAN